MPTSQRALIHPTHDLEENLTREPVLFKHNLQNSSLFQDDALASLIDAARQAGDNYYTLGALDQHGYGDKWQSATGQPG